MKVLQTTIIAALFFVICGDVSEAGRVTIKRVHLCCGACVAAAQETLGEVKGVSKAAADRNSKTISFTVTDDKAAQNAINALAKAGFHGSATHGKKKVKFPASGAKKGETADKITLAGLHLCCTSCVTGAQKALQQVKGATAIEFDRKLNIARVFGKDISVIAAVAALNKGGFHATVKRGK
jgi:copper chaperone CopZ